MQYGLFLRPAHNGDNKNSRTQTLRKSRLLDNHRIETRAHCCSSWQVLQARDCGQSQTTMNGRIKTLIVSIMGTGTQSEMCFESTNENKSYSHNPQYETKICLQRRDGKRSAGGCSLQSVGRGSN